MNRRMGHVKSSLCYYAPLWISACASYWVNVTGNAFYYTQLTKGGKTLFMHERYSAMATAKVNTVPASPASQRRVALHTTKPLASLPVIIPIFTDFVFLSCLMLWPMAAARLAAGMMTAAIIV